MSAESRVKSWFANGHHSDRASVHVSLLQENKPRLRFYSYAYCDQQVIHQDSYIPLTGVLVAVSSVGPGRPGVPGLFSEGTHEEVGNNGEGGSGTGVPS